jgi:glucose-1-phosphate cytidylyltransferase
MTGGRLFKVRNYLQNEKFLCTYGDGLANVNLKNLLKFHNSHGKKSTVTAVRPTNRFATLKITQGNQVRTFSEKPKGENWISGGFFIFEPEVFDYLNENSILEREPLEHLAKDNQLMAYKHHGFWQPMDTYRESQELNSLWDSGSAPWKTW